ncbi:pilus assembly protein PilO [Bacillus sp. B15-48]|uniref:pilus assembly protein PilO n=1 Tax=Bacillus sp. B15-48 TaxID=1548601 RepID=UPI00193F89D1|nr:pilus assembly protein PilO [Bacillus sp. B15-48]MBM4762441.1 pilus assembly protein PilO [Bacillus sp. B15-48]
MNLRFSKNEWILFIVALVILASFLVGSYFVYLKPKQETIVNKQAQLEVEEQLLAAVQARMSESTAPTSESVAELQKKVPVKKQLEQLILDLNKAEVIANSFISNMSFSEGAVSANGGSPESTEEGEGVSLPDGIKKLTVNLSVTSPNYPQLMKFLDTLERLNRRVVIESVSFSGGSELTNVDQEEENISYSLTLSAFYMPELEDLQDPLPELNVPAPSNKKNPFASFADLPQ